MEGIDGKYNLFRSWADLYDKATLEIRKMIACQLITRVEVKRGYELLVYLNPSFAQFLGKEAVENHADEGDDESRGARPAEEGVPPLPVAGGVVEGHERRHAETDADPHI